MQLSPQVKKALGPFQQSYVATDDGTRLSIQSFGQKNRPAIVCANGIGVRFPSMTRQIEALKDSHHIICWDYRGVGESKMSDQQGDVSMPRHAKDAIAVMDHLNVGQAVVMGWSMGVQVSLEMVRSAPSRVNGIIALFGSYGSPFRTGLPMQAALIAERVTHLVQGVPKFFDQLLTLATTFPEITYRLFVTLGFLSDRADRDVFATDVAAVAGSDKTIYLRTLLALVDHDATDVLSRCHVPALVISGAKDQLTPTSVARQMVEQLGAKAMLREVPDGTHFALIEQPSLVNEWILEFSQNLHD